MVLKLMRNRATLRSGSDNAHARNRQHMAALTNLSCLSSIPLHTVGSEFVLDKDVAGSTELVILPMRWRLSGASSGRGATNKDLREHVKYCCQNDESLCIWLTILTGGCTACTVGNSREIHHVLG